MTPPQGGRPRTVQRQIMEGHVSDPNSRKPRPEHGYWLTPPEIYEPLDREFRFDFDPCPNPRPEGFDGLEVPWGRSSYVNPPFWSGLAYWAKKAVREHEEGKGVVFIAPVDRWIWYLLNAGAEARPVRPVNHDWIHTRTGKRQKTPRPSVTFILRGRGLDG